MKGTQHLKQKMQPVVSTKGSLTNDDMNHIFKKSQREFDHYMIPKKMECKKTQKRAMDQYYHQIYEPTNLKLQNLFHIG